MSDRDLKLAAIAVITYAYIVQTGHPPELDDDGIIMEAAALLDDNAFEKTLELCSYADPDSVEVFWEDEE